LGLESRRSRGVYSIAPAEGSKWDGAYSAAQ
jgi:hypothetical protein